MSYLALDTETTGMDREKGCQPFLVTAFDGEQNYHWEWFVDPFTRKVQIEDKDIVEIQKLINNHEHLIFQNAKFDYKFLLSVDIMVPWKKIHDTLIQGHLVNSSMPHDLTSMVLRYLKIDIEPFELEMHKKVLEARALGRKRGYRIAKHGLPELPSVKGAKKEEKYWKYDTWLPLSIATLDDYPSEHSFWDITSKYANADSSSTWYLFFKFKQIIEKRGYWKHYLERMSWLPSITKTEMNGISISGPTLKSLQKEYQQENERKTKLCENVGKELGHPITLGKGVTNELRAFATAPTGLNFPQMEHWDIPVFTEKGNISLNAATLQAITHQLQILEPRGKRLSFINNFRDKRKIDVALTFLESYQKYWVQTTKDFYHVFPSLNPTATSTLRMSCSNPNGQQVSKQEPGEGKNYNLRRVFCPLPGREMFSLDYENIELRIPAYLAKEKVMIELFEKPNEAPYFGSYHLLNASVVFPKEFWPLADKKGAFKEKYGSTLYQRTKNFGFAVQYLAGEAKADATAGVPGAWKAVKKKLPNIDALGKWAIRFCKEHGYVETVPDITIDPDHGYPLYPEKDYKGQVKPTLPLNYIIQGSAMWATGSSMPRCQAYLDTLNKGKPKSLHYKMVLQVHDEIVFDFPKYPNNYNIAKQLAKIMEEAGDRMQIPLKVSINYHPVSWGKAEKYPLLTSIT